MFFTERFKRGVIFFVILRFKTKADESVAQNALFVS